MAPKTKWGSALLPAPTVAAAGTLAFLRLRERASFRRPLSFGPILTGKVLRFADLSGPSCWAGASFLVSYQFCGVRSSGAVPGRMDPAFAEAVAACRALPRFGLLLACCLFRPFRHRSLRSSLSASPSDGPPSGRKGPFRAFWRAAPRFASADACPRSFNLRPCRIRLASGRHSGIRNRSFQLAIRRFQNEPQPA